MSHCRMCFQFDKKLLNYKQVRALGLIECLFSVSRCACSLFGLCLGFLEWVTKRKIKKYISAELGDRIIAGKTGGNGEGLLSPSFREPPGLAPITCTPQRLSERKAPRGEKPRIEMQRG